MLPEPRHIQAIRELLNEEDLMYPNEFHAVSLDDQAMQEAARERRIQTAQKIEGGARSVTPIPLWAVAMLRGLLQ